MGIFSKLFGGKSEREVLFGKKGTPERIEELERDQDIVDTQRQARSMQRSGLSGLMQGPAAGTLAEQTAQARERAARAARTDAERNLQSQIARRGLGGSSIGLSQLVGLQRQQAQQIGDIRAQQPLLQEQFRRQRLQDILSGAGNVLARPGLGKQYVKFGATQGTKGLAPLIGGAAGAAFGGMAGGPAGAQAGGQTGMGMGTALSGTFQ